jgi:hypothetical protein
MTALPHQPPGSSDPANGIDRRLKVQSNFDKRDSLKREQGFKQEVPCKFGLDLQAESYTSNAAKFGYSRTLISGTALRHPMLRNWVTVALR